MIYETVNVMLGIWVIHNQESNFICRRQPFLIQLLLLGVSIVGFRFARKYKRKMIGNRFSSHKDLSKYPIRNFFHPWWTYKHYEHKIAKYSSSKAIAKSLVYHFSIF